MVAFREAVLAVVVGRVLYPLTLVMPPPYEDGGAVAIPPADAALLPGQVNGSAFPPAFVGAWALNEELTRATRLFEGIVVGSESVAVAGNGDLVTVDRYGWVWVSGAGGADQAPPVKRWYVGPGRPLGFHATPKNTLLVACSTKGLLELDMATGALRVLANVADDTREPLNYVNDLDVDGSTGKVYFSSSTRAGVRRDAKRGFYDTMQAYLMCLMRGDASGRLLASSIFFPRLSLPGSRRVSSRADSASPQS